MIGGSSSSIGNTTTLNLILGIFLKLLGFFVVLYVFTDVDPDKARLAEESLKERFNISVTLTNDIHGTSSENSHSIAQGMGRAFQEIDTAMKTQVDFLSTEYQAQNHVLLLRVPAEIALDIGMDRARSFDFPKILVDTLLKQRPPQQAAYQVEAVVSGADRDALMRAVSLFIQKMIAFGYPVEQLVIGYEESAIKPVLELRISEVRS